MPGRGCKPTTNPCIQLLYNHHISAMDNKLQFKTNINCNGCIRSVTGFINDVPGIQHWEVDIDNPEKILTVQGNVTPEAVVEAVEEAGFDIAPVA